MYGGDTGRERGGGRSRPQRAPEQFDRARVGAKPAGQDVHQRGLAGAILTEQRDDLARTGVEVDAVEREQRAEAAGEVAGGEHRRPPAQAGGGGP